MESANEVWSWESGLSARRSVGRGSAVAVRPRRERDGGAGAAESITRAQ